MQSSAEAKQSRKENGRPTKTKASPELRQFYKEQATSKRKGGNYKRHWSQEKTAGRKTVRGGR